MPSYLGGDDPSMTDLARKTLGSAASWQSRQQSNAGRHDRSGWHCCKRSRGAVRQCSGFKHKLNKNQCCHRLNVLLGWKVVSAYAAAPDLERGNGRRLPQRQNRRNNHRQLGTRWSRVGFNCFCVDCARLDNLAGTWAQEGISFSRLITKSGNGKAMTLSRKKSPV